MGVISIVNGDYKPTNITGGYHLVILIQPSCFEMVLTIVSSFYWAA
jgi:hypothetical protein